MIWGSLLYVAATYGLSKIGVDMFAKINNIVNLPQNLIQNLLSGTENLDGSPAPLNNENLSLKNRPNRDNKSKNEGKTPKRNIDRNRKKKESSSETNSDDSEFEKKLDLMLRRHKNKNSKKESGVQYLLDLLEGTSISEASSSIDKKSDRSGAERIRVKEIITNFEKQRESSATPTKVKPRKQKVGDNRMSRGNSPQKKEKDPLKSISESKAEIHRRLERIN